MPTFTLIIAAIIQGITEFLPVSSSAHLFLWNHFQHVPEGGFPYEMVLGAGTLLATVIYFRRELMLMVRDVFKQIAGQGSTPYSHLAWMLVFSTIPVCVIGFLFHDLIENHLRSIALMGSMLMFFGLLLGLSDLRAPIQEQSSNGELRITFKQALFIGLMQIFSLIPGASRSGTTITAARFLRLDRKTSVRFSFLLSIPVTAAACALDIFKAIKAQLPFDPIQITLGFGLSAIVGLLCIHVLLQLIQRVGLWPFAVYRLIFGAMIVALFW